MGMSLQSLIAVYILKAKHVSLLVVLEDVVGYIHPVGTMDFTTITPVTIITLST